MIAKLQCFLFAVMTKYLGYNTRRFQLPSYSRTHMVGGMGPWVARYVTFPDVDLQYRSSQFVGNPSFISL